MDWKEKIRYKLSAKLQSRFTGPYLIVRQLSPVLYVAIVDSKEKTIHTVNMKHTPLVRDQSSPNFAAARRRDQNRIHGAKVSEMQTALPEVSSKIPERHRALPEVRSKVPEVGSKVSEGHRALPEVSSKIAERHRTLPEVRSKVPEVGARFRKYIGRSRK